MPGLTICWEYLTGCCVATDPASRQRAEWPPHPGRVFMAMAAAWFETGENEAEGQALRWLEKLGDPAMLLPPFSAVFQREIVEVYVPVNDQADPYDWQDKKKKPTIHMNLGSVTFGRARQPRTFPSVWVGDAPCFLLWPNADAAGAKSHRPSLDQLCSKVTRIGHSSSLVRMWVADEVTSSQPTETWVPDDGLAELQARRVSEGTLDLLDRQFNAKPRFRYQQLEIELASLDSQRTDLNQQLESSRQQIMVLDAELREQKRTITGNRSATRKQELTRQFAARKAPIELQVARFTEQLEKLEARRTEVNLELNRLDIREPIRPKLGLWTGYRRKEAEPLPPMPHTNFDSDLLILTQVDGPRLPLASTLAVTQALRGAIMAHIGSNIPDWISGHKPNKEPLRNGNQQMAYIPLPFVGSEYADGHLLGVGLVFPRSIPRAERGRVLGRFLMSSSGEPHDIPLTLGRLGVWTVRKRDWMEQRQALQPETWTAHPRGAATWASVTPVVLDRFPKCDPIQEREAWHEEVSGIIATSCERLGLPAPVEVAVGTTSWHRGSPRATAKRRPLRGHPEMPNISATLGDGFPIYPAKGGNGARPQLHICVRFAEPVVGPILLCAGRFLGYGLCKPLWGGVAQ